MEGKVFISYRRADQPGYAMAVYSQLEKLFKPEQLFIDVEYDIPAGSDFVKLLEKKVEECDLMLVIIGPNWLRVADGYNQQNVAVDFVRLEIEMALRFRKQIIPVLVNKSMMPQNH